MDYSEKIQDYIDGLLSPEDHAAFEAELQANANLKSQYDEYLGAGDLAKGLLEMDLMDTLSKVKDQEDNSGEEEKPARKEPSKDNPRKRKRLWFIPAIAASLALVIFFINQDTNYNDVQFADIYEEPIWPTKRSDQTSPLEKAISDFLKSKEVESAKLSLLSDDGIAKDEAHYWIAEMYLNTMQKDSTDRYLDLLPADHIKKSRISEMREMMKALK